MNIEPAMESGRETGPAAAEAGGIRLTDNDARQSLAAHVAAKGAEIREKYGPGIGWRELQLILADRDFVRYPCEISFDAELLQPEEMAYAAPKGDKPEDGFTIAVHPFFSLDPARVPLPVLYQIVTVNYGAFASPDDAEAFGASVLGLSQEDYYAALCGMADEISSEISTEGTSCSGAGGTCSCGSSEA